MINFLVDLSDSYLSYLRMYLRKSVWKCLWRHFWRLLLPGALSLFLMACTNAEPTTSFTSMDGLGLFGPKSIASGTLETKGYITIGGQCSSLVQRFEVSALLNTGVTSNWYPLNPQEAAGAGETSPSSESLVFDQDCSDGNFLVYIFRHSLNSWFASGSTAGKDNISKFFLRGILTDGTLLSGQTLVIDPCAVSATKYSGEIFCHTLCGAGQWYNKTSHICENVGFGFFSPANDDSRTACPPNSLTAGVVSASAAECVASRYQCLGQACGLTEPGNHYGKSVGAVGDYQMISTSGGPNRDLVKKSPGGYKMYLSTKGILFSPN
jgi:hypothetical protein